jgi:hypothetical protein
LELRGNGLQPSAQVRRRLEEKLVDVRGKLVAIQKVERELRLALRKCNKELRRGSPHCPVLGETNKRSPGSNK